MMGDAFDPRPCASRRVTLRCLALSAAVTIALSGCNKPADPATGKPAKGVSGYIKKVCDEGRAVYFDATGHAEVAVVENAPECRK